MVAAPYQNALTVEVVAWVAWQGDDGLAWLEVTDAEGAFAVRSEDFGVERFFVQAQ